MKLLRSAAGYLFVCGLTLICLTGLGCDDQGHYTSVPDVPSSFTVANQVVQGGANTIGTVTLAGPAPAGGVQVAVSSSNAAAAQTPSTVIFEQGQSMRQFTINTSTVTAPTQVTITASANNGTKTMQFTIQPGPVAPDYETPAGPQSMGKKKGSAPPKQPR